MTGSHNLVDDGSDGLKDTIKADPKLDPKGPQNNGGPTQTIKLLAGSPAIDKGGPDTTLKSAVDALATSTSLSVVSAAGLAVTPGLTIQIDAEQMTITAVDTTNNTFTVQRGANFTTVAKHDAGAGLLPATDQRGFARVSAAAVDIGAFELQPDFSISVSPSSLTVPPGSSGGATISTAVTAGSAQAVALSAAGLPPGVTASFSPASVTAGLSSTLSLTAAASAAAGTFTVTITGTEASVFHTTTLSLTIGQKAQTITFAPLANPVYGVAPFSLAATASSGLPVTYTLSGPAALAGTTLTVTGAGVVNVTASQAGNATYSAAPPVQQSFTVSQAPLTVTAKDATIIQGEALPTTFGLSYSGFVNNEGPGVLGGTPTFTLTATGPTTYAIQPDGLTASNYQITFASGTLTVLSWSVATTNLLKQVNDAGLDQGTQNSLDSKLQAAIDSFNQGNTTAAKNQLAAFLNEVSAQSGKKIDAALADALSASAQEILNAIG
jgi:hypothetical protein